MIEVLIGAFVSTVVEYIKKKTSLTKDKIHIAVFIVALVVATIMAMAKAFPSFDAYLQAAIAIVVSAFGVYEVILKRLSKYFDVDGMASK